MASYMLTSKVPEEAHLFIDTSCKVPVQAHLRVSRDGFPR